MPIDAMWNTSSGITRAGKPLPRRASRETSSRPSVALCNRIAASLPPARA
jgi:hypothetical protein